MTDLPDGSLLKAWVDLTSGHSPQTKDELVHLKQEFATFTMEPGQDPEEYLTHLEAPNHKIRTEDAT